MAAQVDGRSNPEQRFRPFGDQDLYKKLEQSMGPLPGKMYICTHALFGRQFQEIPRTSGIHDEPPRDPRLVCFGRETSRGLGTTSLLPKIILPEPVGWRKRNGNNRIGSKTRPWGRGKEARWP